MTRTEARTIFDTAIGNQLDADKRASLELCREYFTNPTFMRALQGHVYALNTSGAAS